MLYSKYINNIDTTLYYNLADFLLKSKKKKKKWEIR